MTALSEINGLSPG